MFVAQDLFVIQLISYGESSPLPDENHCADFENEDSGSPALISTSSTLVGSAESFFGSAESLLGSEEA